MLGDRMSTPPPYPAAPVSPLFEQLEVQKNTLVCIGAVNLRKTLEPILACSPALLPCCTYYVGSYFPRLDIVRPLISCQLFPHLQIVLETLLHQQKSWKIRRKIFVGPSFLGSLLLYPNPVIGFPFRGRRCTSGWPSPLEGILRET